MTPGYRKRLKRGEYVLYFTILRRKVNTKIKKRNKEDTRITKLSCIAIPAAFFHEEGAVRREGIPGNGPAVGIAD